MSCVPKFLGRLLFVTLLVSSAYLHISKPQQYVDSFSTHYSEAIECANQHIKVLSALPTASEVNWILWVQIYGAFQGLIALFIMIGDGVGGFLLFVTLIVSGSFKFCQIQSFLQWDVQRQLQVAKWAFFVGASLILMCSSCKKNSSKQNEKKCC